MKQFGSKEIGKTYFILYHSFENVNNSLFIFMFITSDKNTNGSISPTSALCDFISPHLKTLLRGILAKWSSFIIVIIKYCVHVFTWQWIFSGLFPSLRPFLQMLDGQHERQHENTVQLLRKYLQKIAQEEVHWFIWHFARIFSVRYKHSYIH